MKAVLVFLLGLALAPAAWADTGKLPSGKYKVPGTRSGFVTTPDGVRIHYLEAGPPAVKKEIPWSEAGSWPRRPPRGNYVLARPQTILFVPGWTMPAWIWEHQITHFAKTHRVVAMDPRSQGRSSQTTEGHYPAARARDIKAVVDALKLAPAVLVGWSMGVNEVVAYVDQFGTDTVAGLVLVDGGVGFDADPATTKAMNNWTAGFYKDRRSATEKFVREMYKKPQSEDYYRRVTQASLRTPTNTALALLVGSMSTDNRPALAKISKSTLVIAAPTPWIARVEDMQKRIAGSRLEVFEGAGHALFVDEPERFNSLLAEFLTGLR